MSIALLASCNVDFIATEYAGNSSVSFGQSVVSNTEIPASQTTYSIDLVRGNASAAQTINIAATLPAGISCPASASFAAGEYSTTIDLDISSLEVGVTSKGTLSIEDALNKEEKAISIKTTSFTLAKAYTWQNIGKGEFYDGLALQPSDDDLGIIKVDILKAEGFNRWRVLTPFPKDNVIAAWSPDYWVGGESTVIELWEDEEGTIHWDSPIKTGLTYLSLGTNCYIYYYYPEDYNSKYAADNALNCFVADNVIQLYDAMIIENSTSWFGWGAQYLMLPGGSVTSLEDFLME